MTFNDFLITQPLYQHFNALEEAWAKGDLMFSDAKRVNASFWEQLKALDNEHLFIPTDIFKRFFQSMNMQDQLKEFLEAYIIFNTEHKNIHISDMITYIMDCKHISREINMFHEVAHLSLDMVTIMRHVDSSQSHFIQSPTDNLMYHLLSQTLTHFPRGTFMLDDSFGTLFKDRYAPTFYRLLSLVSPFDMTPEFLEFWVQNMFNGRITQYIQQLTLKNIHPDWLNSRYAGIILPILIHKKKHQILTPDAFVLEEEEVAPFYQYLMKSLSYNYIESYKFFSELSRLRYPNKTWHKMDALYFYAEMIYDNPSKSWQEFIPREKFQHEKNKEYWIQHFFNLPSEIFFSFMKGKTTEEIMEELGNSYQEALETPLMI